MHIHTVKKLGSVISQGPFFYREVRGSSERELPICWMKSNYLSMKEGSCFVVMIFTFTLGPTAQATLVFPMSVLSSRTNEIHSLEAHLNV
jgi:hypothetical protein